MRIVHYYALYLNHPSGVTESIDSWVEQARSHGHDVRIVAAPVDDPRPLSPDVAPVVRQLRHLGRRRVTWLPLGLGRRLAAGDVLYLHEGWVLSNVVAAWQARRAGATIVVMPHGVYEPGIVTKTRDVLGIRRRLEQTVLRWADRVHVFYPSERDVVTAVSGSSGADDRFVVLPNGAPDPMVGSWSGTGDYFLWMGRFDPDHKGIDNLVRLWHALPEPRPPLVLAGPDFEGGRDRVREQVTDFGLDGSISIRGHVSGQEKAALIEGCVAYIHPSRWESCSILLLEMLAAGVPTLVSASIHAAEPLAAQGLVLTHDMTDPRDASVVLGAVARNAELGERAQRWVKESGSWERVGEAYGSWLESLAREEQR